MEADQVPMKVKVKVAQPCSSLCDPMDCSLPRSSVHGILQSRILEWELFPSPGDLPNPGSELGSPALQRDSLPAELPRKPINIRENFFCASRKGRGKGTILKYAIELFFFFF